MIEIIFLVLTLIFIIFILIPRKPTIIQVFPPFEKYSLDPFLDSLIGNEKKKKIYSRYIEWCEEKKIWCLPFKTFNRKLRLSLQEREKNKNRESTSFSAQEQHGRNKAST